MREGSSSPGGRGRAEEAQHADTSDPSQHSNSQDHSSAARGQPPAVPRLDTTWPEECEFEDEVEDELSEGARRQLACVLLSSLVASSLVWFAWAMFLFATGHLSVRELDEEILAKKPSPAIPWGLMGRFAGACAFGHLGDIGMRRTALAYSLHLTALTTFLMGVLPPSKMVTSEATWATLRLLQGAGVGGAWAGSIIWPAECCLCRRARPMVASVPHAGVAVGWSMAALVSSAAVGAGRGWLWRLAFWVCAVGLLAMGVCVEWGGRPCLPLPASGELQALVPLLQLLRRRKRRLLQGLLAAAVEPVVFFMLLRGWVLMLPTAAPTTPALVFLSIACGGLAAFTLLGGALADRCGAARLYIVAALFTGPAVFLWHYFLQPARGYVSHTVIFLTTIGIALGFLEGTLPVLLLYRFPVALRYTALGLIYHGSHLLLTSSLPSIITSLGLPVTYERADHRFDAAVLGVVVALVSAVSAFATGHFVDGPTGPPELRTLESSDSA